MRPVALLAGMLLGTAPLLAAGLSEKPLAVTVAIYHHDIDGGAYFSLDQSDSDQGLAFVTETREIDVPAGPAEIFFRGVAETMVPQTADIKGLPDGTIDRNFDYDLLTPATLLAKSVGEKVRLVRTDSKTGRTTQSDAIIRSGPDGVVLETGGKIEALGCGGLTERLVFDKIPGGLTDTPTLSVHTNAAHAGHYTVKLSYIATGLNWSADYVAHVNPDGRTLSLGGWISLANFTGTSFKQAPVQVIAGKPMESGEDQPQAIAHPERDEKCWPNGFYAKKLFRVSAEDIGAFPDRVLPAPAPMETVVVTGMIGSIAAQRLGDYKLYPLPEPTDVAARQIKQVQFLDQPDVPFRHLYIYGLMVHDRPDGKPRPATATLQLTNEKDSGLGQPLPAGGVSVMEPGPDNSQVLAGQQSVTDTPVGQPLEIQTGRAMDIPVTAGLVELSSIKGRAYRRKSYEVAVRNGKSQPALFEFRYGVADDDVTLVSQSQDHVLNKGAWVWSFSLRPGEQAVLRYTVDVPAF
jgi:hypothetical protein